MQYYLSKLLSRIFNNIKKKKFKYETKKILQNKNSKFSKKKNKYPQSGFFNYDYNYKPKTSFIFANFMAEKTLLKSLKNLESLRKYIEIIIVHDRVKLSRELNDTLKNSNDLIVCSKDLGEIQSYINGAKLSRASDFLIFCQSDDLIPADPAWYNDCMREFKKDKKLGLISLNGGGYYDKQFKGIDYSRTKKKPIREYCIWLKYGPFVVRKDLYLKIGGFKHWSLIGETGGHTDQYFSLEILKEGFKSMLLINKNTEKWIRRHDRDDGFEKVDLVKNKLREKSFIKNEKNFLNAAKKDILKFQAKLKR